MAKKKSVKRQPKMSVKSKKVALWTTKLKNHRREARQETKRIKDKLAALGVH